jgi:flagellar biogenesis protein FliO
MAASARVLFALLLALGAGRARLLADEPYYGGEIVRSAALPETGTLEEAAEAPLNTHSDDRPLDDESADWQHDESDRLLERRLPPNREYDVQLVGDEQEVEAGATTAPSFDSPKPKTSLPLAAKGRGERASEGTSALKKPSESLITVGGSLCVVLSLFFGVAWLARRGTPHAAGRLPGEVIEVLGRSPLVKGQDLQLVRIGGKLLLIGVTPSGCETLTEITEAAEVDRLAAICRRNNPNSISAAFNQVLAGMGREPASGFAGTPRTSADRSERRGGRYA